MKPIIFNIYSFFLSLFGLESTPTIFKYPYFADKEKIDLIMNNLVKIEFNLSSNIVMNLIGKQDESDIIYANNDKDKVIGKRHSYIIKRNSDPKIEIDKNEWIINVDYNTNDKVVCLSEKKNKDITFWVYKNNIQYPYNADNDKILKITSGLEKINKGDSITTIQKVLGVPDETYSSRNSKSINSTIVGKKHWYILRQLVEYGSELDKNKWVIAIDYDCNGIVAYVHEMKDLKAKTFLEPMTGVKELNSEDKNKDTRAPGSNRQEGEDERAARKKNKDTHLLQGKR